MNRFTIWSSSIAIFLVTLISLITPYASHALDCRCPKGYKSVSEPLVQIPGNDMPSVADHFYRDQVVGPLQIGTMDPVCRKHSRTVQKVHDELNAIITRSGEVMFSTYCGGKGMGLVQKIKLKDSKFCEQKPPGQNSYITSSSLESYEACGCCPIIEPIACSATGASGE